MKILKRIALALVLLILLAAAPIVGTELACRAPADSAPDSFSGLIQDPAWQRAEMRSYLSYPEWSIVHAYEDFAGVLREQDEYAFDYLSSIGAFWRGLCGVNRIASASGGGPTDIKVMLYTIGLSFTAEMGIKGAYEESLGRLFAWIRGPGRTPEDILALAVAEDYAAFLRQTPWYEYPFGDKVRELWALPLGATPSLARSVERRVALTLEWGAKAGYAALIGMASQAALGEADLRIRSVMRPGPGGLPEGADLISSEPDARLLVETPRYRAFTEILQRLSAEGGTVDEIAGNDDILVTVLVPSDSAAAFAGATEVFAVPVQARPGWRRLGLSVKVGQLTELMRNVAAEGATFEHVYDY